VDMVNRIVPQLIKHGKVIRPGLGITVIPDTIAARWRVQGVVIREVAPEGPAARAGLKGVRSARGGQVLLGDDLLTILDRHKVGDQVTIEVVREGKSQTVSITLQAVE
jgi:S1-C subfamily serine protease